MVLRSVIFISLFMGNNNSGGISANHYYFPGYSWPSSFLTSATKLANGKSNISSDISSIS